MASDLFSMIDNTFKFLGTPAGITILVLLAVCVIEFLIILLLMWIIKNNFKKIQTGGATNEKQQ